MKHKEGLGRDKIDKLPNPNINTFIENTNDLTKFVERIDEQEDPEIKTSMRNYSIIRLKSLFEYHLKEFLIEIIDDKNLNVKGEDVLREEAITLQLDLLDEMQKDNDREVQTKLYSKGRIICGHLNILGPRKLFSIMTRLNEVYFGEWFVELLGGVGGKDKEDNILMQSLNKLFTERNDVIHNLKDTILDANELEEEIDNIAIVLERILAFSKINLYQKIDEDEFETLCEQVNISPERFIEITKKLSRARSN